MKCGESVIVNVTRREADFDRACDEAYHSAMVRLGMDENGNSSRVTDWERSRCWVEVKFNGYKHVGSMGGHEHQYEFVAHAFKSPEEQ